MDIIAFVNHPLAFKGVLKGVYTVMKPDASRMTVLILARNFRTYCLYIRQRDMENIEIELRDDEPTAIPQFPLP